MELAKHGMDRFEKKGEMETEKRDCKEAEDNTILPPGQDLLVETTGILDVPTRRTSRNAYAPRRLT